MSRSSRTFSRTLQSQLPWSRTVQRARPSTTLLTSLRNNLTRHASTAASYPTSTSSPSGQQSKWLRCLFNIALFGSLGYAVGSISYQGAIAPPPPGTDEDAKEMGKISKLLNYYPLVSDLRKDPDYVEWEAYENFTDEEKAHRLSSGPLRGSRGFALQVGGFRQIHAFLSFFLST